jgi:glucan-binding YG repeat protein
LEIGTDENTTWEVGLTEGLQEFKLPQVINVNLSFKFVESVGTTEVFGKVKVKGADGKETEVTRPVSKARIFGYGEAPTQVENKEDKQKKLDASGTPKPKEETPVNQQSATPTKEENPAKQAMKPEEPDTFKKVHTTPEAGNKFYIYSKKDAYGLYIATAYEKEDKKGYVTNVMGKTEDKAVENLIESLDFRNDFVPDGGNEPSISTLKTLKANRGK